MNCPNCAAVMVNAKATDFGSEYFYCRVCKKELSEMVVLETPAVEDLASAFEMFVSHAGTATGRLDWAGFWSPTSTPGYGVEYGTRACYTTHRGGTSTPTHVFDSAAATCNCGDIKS